MEAARIARGEDLDRLGELVHLALEGAVSRRGGLALAGRWAGVPDTELRDALDTAMADTDTGVWVGTIDAAVVGAAVASGPAGCPAVLHLLFVEPPARGIGVGEAMLDEVTRWLGHRGCTSLDVSVLPGDRDTKQFFEGASMVARLIVMHRAL